MSKPKLFIASPCYGGTCYVNYMISLMKARDLLRENGIETKIHFTLTESLIQRGRNLLVASFLRSDCTHLLFIDNDLVFNEYDVLKLLKYDKGIVGGIYPKKNYTWNNFDKARKRVDEIKNHPINKDISEVDLLKQNLLSYNLNVNKDSTKIEGNLLEIYTLPTGFMMIKREVFEKLMKAHPEWEYKDDTGHLDRNGDNRVYSFFDCGIVDDHYFSEDWFFCKRCIDIGEKIYADVTINLTHIGYVEYQGRLLSSLTLTD